MKEEKATVKEVTEITIKPERKSIRETLKTKATELMACKGCKKREAAAHGAARKVAVVAGTTAVGVGTGVVVGVGALTAATVAAVAVPAILTFKALGVTGGAMGFLKGAKKRAGGARQPSKTATNAVSADELLKDAKRAGSADELLKDAKKKI